MSRRQRANPNLGRWALCYQGRLGRIESVNVTQTTVYYIGFDLEGRPWQSTTPRFVSREHGEALDRAFPADE